MSEGIRDPSSCVASRDAPSGPRYSAPDRPVQRVMLRTAASPVSQNLGFGPTTSGRSSASSLAISFRRASECSKSIRYDSQK